ncbi:protein EVI2A [Neopsephotus bourkii]|uniref:protein EVI2A n=1 Tax=Neopsephotus bourkii TaxID=309878 RepID=UPI002AA555D6|nr:protein EVI2A [Neopsephotus bourkii]XP_061219321.1 protein EVI2A [Neopsephotus bourkii]
MKTRRSKPGSAFPVLIIFALYLQTSANHTNYPGLINETWNSTSQNPSGSQNITDANTDSPLSINFSSKTTTLEMQTGTMQSVSSTTAQNLTSSPVCTAVATSATGGPRNSSKPKSTGAKETCEDSKPLIMICFIVIAVLVLICTFLFLSTVVIANKMSYLKKAQQGKRRPRSNGDILATNSLWPMAAGTWQRMKETTGTDLIMQDLIPGRDSAIPRETEGETTKKFSKEADNKQGSKEPLKSHKPILTNFVVEI